MFKYTVYLYMFKYTTNNSTEKSKAVSSYNAALHIRVKRQPF